MPIGEPEAAALAKELGRWEQIVSSTLLGIEVQRACLRADAEALRRADGALALVTLVRIDDPILEVAARLQPPALRSLDAIHLATALSLGDDLGVFVAYDQRLIAAAEAAGLPTASPV